METLSPSTDHEGRPAPWSRAVSYCISPLEVALFVYLTAELEFVHSKKGHLLFSAHKETLRTGGVSLPCGEVGGGLSAAICPIQFLATVIGYIFIVMLV